MENPRILVWYRKDLRVNDNYALAESLEISKSLTAIYIFDEKYNLDYNSQSRAWFLGASLKELRLKWKNAGSDLIIAKGDPAKLIPQITKLINAKFVAWNKSLEPYEIERDNIIKKRLLTLNVNVIDFWDHLLSKPSQIYTGSNKPYTVYGPFLKKIKSQLNNFESTKDYSINTKDFAIKGLSNELNNNQIIKSSQKILKEFITKNDFKGANICPCLPGEIAAESLLDHFISSNRINTYNSNRDFPAQIGTSYLSASLRFGTISIRKLWNKTVDLILNETNQESIISIETWQKELIWREFYQHCLFNFPLLENGPYRKKWNSFPWQNNNDWFMRWSEGNTGVPIVDAAMRQLNNSGWMHNRCRMIVASFLVKDLICNWQMGEKKFMELLVDGDLAANNGGWQWSASSGMDPKPLRIFNPYTQTQKFDPLCAYIKFWIPELKNVSNTEIIKGDIQKAERNQYPSPIINHSAQQRIFKSIYADISSSS